MRPRLSSQALLACTALLVSCGSATTSSSSAGTGTTSSRDPLTFTPSSLPVGYVGEAYKVDIGVTGGAGPYGIRLVSGTLPPGVGLQSRQVSGTPTKTGTYTFTLEASDANLSSKAQAYTVNVNELPPLSLKPQLPPGGDLRGETRVPLNITAPRAVRAARVVWELPEGVAVTRIQLADAGGVLFWKQVGKTLTLDLGFKAVPRSGARVALIALKPQKAVTLDTTKLAVEARNGEGQLLTDAIKPAPQKTETPKAEAPKAAAPAVSAAQAAGAGSAAPASMTQTPASTQAPPASSTPATSGTPPTNTTAPAAPGGKP
ncbi:Ig domain-containing protein [Deinococcus hopiensis]|uniref:Uncharacterized protein n=1 Tax=Deinococcus hopiensis KR-140 TaxID=695939 RepID=A0A1W1VMW5_9DEIO|nr:Ig domain-containing protein [Deinococcus hopiensis]SMB94709.1 hypothetical protein SAMN00790413_02497 [Deinococcus hopiensis KR-140]